MTQFNKEIKEEKKIMGKWAISDDVVWILNNCFQRIDLSEVKKKYVKQSTKLMFMVNGAETEEIIEIISLLKGIGDHLAFTNEKISV